MPKVITDTERLNFMLRKSRKVLAEILPFNELSVYVEEGFMGETAYEAVLISDIAKPAHEVSDAELEKYKRQAIDKAIAQSC